jgi:hypothetical protein
VSALVLPPYAPHNPAVLAPALPLVEGSQLANGELVAHRALIEGAQDADGELVPALALPPYARHNPATIYAALPIEGSQLASGELFSHLPLIEGAQDADGELVAALPLPPYGQHNPATLITALPLVEGSQLANGELVKALPLPFPQPKPKPVPVVAAQQPQLPSSNNSKYVDILLGDELPANDITVRAFETQPRSAVKVSFSRRTTLLRVAGIGDTSYKTVTLDVPGSLWPFGARMVVSLEAPESAWPAVLGLVSMLSMSLLAVDRNNSRGRRR